LIILPARQRIGFSLVISGVPVEPRQQIVQVGGGEPPSERLCRGVVAVFERSEPLPDLGQLGEVVGRDDLALDDGEEDLHLVQLGGVPLVGQAPGGTRAVGEELT
jgi:hypothetical protein